MADNQPIPPSALQTDLYNRFPWTKGLPFNLLDETATGDPDKSGRKLEFYPANEQYNPKPGLPTIQVFDKSMGASDIMGELLSHHLPTTDPVVSQIRGNIIRSMTPEQIAEIQGDYNNELKAGLVDKGDDLKAWLNKQGGDSFFRGYPTGQWPKETYTPEQIKQYELLDQHLNISSAHGWK